MDYAKMRALELWHTFISLPFITTVWGIKAIQVIGSYFKIYNDDCSQNINILHYLFLPTNKQSVDENATCK